MNKRFALAAAAALVLGVFVSPAAYADAPATDETTIDAEVAYALDHYAGGYATSEHTAYWPKTDMEFTSSQGFAARSVGSCATGAVCAYSGTSLSGSKLSWSSCGTFSTSALPSVGSIANARSSNTLRARNGTTIVATASAGGQANVWSTVTNVQCI